MKKYWAWYCQQLWHFPSAQDVHLHPASETTAAQTESAAEASRRDSRSRSRDRRARQAEGLCRQSRKEDLKVGVIHIGNPGRRLRKLVLCT